LRWQPISREALRAHGAMAARLPVLRSTITELVGLIGELKQLMA
jgi:hypothetical protein